MINKDFNNNFWLPFVSAVSLIISLMIMLNTPTASGYEISIIDSFPFYLWGCIGITIVVSIFSLLNNEIDVNTRKLSFMFLILTNIIILCLPIIRGYFFYGRSDVMGHLASINQILSDGFISINNFYPISHIFGSIFVQITGVDPKFVVMIIPIFFFMVFIAGIYLLSNFITQKIDRVLFLFAFAGILLYSYFGSMFLPNSLSFYFLPIILYAFVISLNYKHYNISYSIILVILLFLLAFFHPLNSINLIIIFIIALFSILAINFRTKISKHLPVLNIDRNRVINVLLILVVTFTVWFTSYAIFQRSFKRVYDSLMHDLGTTPLDSYQSSIFSTTMTTFQLLKEIFLSYGHEIIFILIAFFAVVLIIKNRRKLQNNSNSRFFRIFFPLNFFVFLFMSALILTGSFGLNNPQRELIYALFFSVLINGFVLYDWVYKNDSKKYMKIILLTALLSVCALTGIYSTYSSLAMGSTNFQVSESEFVGSNLLFGSTNSSAYYYSFNDAFRYSEVVNGIDESMNKRYRYFKLPPKHFNFNDTPSGRYLVLNEYVTQRYSIFFQNHPSYSKGDFENLQNNPRLFQFYDNGDLRVWMIQK